MEVYGGSRAWRKGDGGMSTRKEVSLEEEKGHKKAEVGEGQAAQALGDGERCGAPVLGGCRW